MSCSNNRLLHPLFLSSFHLLVPGVLQEKLNLQPFCLQCPNMNCILSRLIVPRNAKGCSPSRGCPAGPSCSRKSHLCPKIILIKHCRRMSTAWRDSGSLSHPGSTDEAKPDHPGSWASGLQHTPGSQCPETSKAVAAAVSHGPPMSG